MAAGLRSPRTSPSEAAITAPPQSNASRRLAPNPLEFGSIIIDDPDEFAIIDLTAQEMDDLSADDSLCMVRVWLYRPELAALVDQTMLRVLRRLRGDGGGYTVQIAIEVQ